MNNYCIYCGEKLTENSRFCIKCGKKIKKIKKKKFCPNCGHHVGRDNFCTDCGLNLVNPPQKEDFFKRNKISIIVVGLLIFLLIFIITIRILLYMLL